MEMYQMKKKEVEIELPATILNLAYPQVELEARRKQWKIKNENNRGFFRMKPWKYCSRTMDTFCSKSRTALYKRDPDHIIGINLQNNISNISHLSFFYKNQQAR